MRMVFPYYGIDIDFVENRIEVLTVENRNAFSAILADLWAQSNGDDGDAVLSENDKILKISGICECIYNIYNINCNDKKILTKIYQEMSYMSGETLVEETAKLNCILVEYIDDILKTVPYGLTQKLDLDVVGLLKLYDVKVEAEATSVLENLINYMGLANKVIGKKLFIFADLKHYFDENNLKSLYEYAFYEKIHILIVEGDDISHLDEEKHMILDNDLCIIDL